MDCFIDVTTLRSLRKLTGNNDALFMACRSEAVGSNNQPTKKFAKWYADNNDGKIISSEEFDSEYVAKQILKYHYSIHPDGNITARVQTDSSEVIIFGYTDVIARNFSKRVLANQMLVIASTSEVRSIKEDDKRKEYVIAKAKNSIKALLVDRIASIKNVSRKEALEEFKKGIKNLDEIFNSETVSYQDKNLYALFNEIIARSRVENNPDVTLSKKIFEEAFSDSRLSSFRFPKEIDDELNANQAENEKSTEDSEKVDKEEDTDYKDEFILNTEHSGIFNSFEKHIGDKLTLYLSTIPKLMSTEGDRSSRINDTANPLGVQDFHSSKELYSVLYSGDIDYSNIVTMKNSIKKIAEQNKHLSGMIVIVEDIEKDTDLAYELYRTFSKLVITKQQVIYDGKTSSINTTNKTSDKTIKLIFNYLNDVRQTLINVENSDITKKLVAIGLDLDTVYKKTSTGFEARSEVAEYKLINDITELLQVFIPSIENHNIESYIRNNKHKNNEKANIQELLTIITKLNKEVEGVKSNYISRQSAIKEANRINRLLNLSKQKDYEFRQQVWDKYSNGEYPKAEHYKDANSIKQQEYLTNETITIVNDLVSKLSNYTQTDIELNSYNVHRNKSSNVINSSWLVNFEKTFANYEALVNFGNMLFQSNQFKHSNSLVEQRDVNGRIINKGLFRLKDGKYVPTEYANKLLKIKLFDGAENNSNNTNAVYSEFSDPDYVATAFSQFFDSVNSERILGGHNVIADYFMRTPSDASRNFVITAPRYSTKGLFKIENEVEAKKLIENKINEIPTISQDEQGVYATMTAVSVNKDKALIDLTAKKLGDKIIKRSQINVESEQSLDRKLQKGDRITVTYSYKDSNNNITEYVLEGIYGDTKGTDIVFEKPKLIGVLSQDYNGNKIISNDLKQAITDKYKQELIKSGEIKRVVDTNHIIYQQYKNVFIQELLNAKTAFNAIFEPDGNGEFKEKLHVDQTFANYHQKGGKLYKIVNGRKTLVGNVFRSSKFTFKGKNYLGELFEHADNSDNEVETIFDFLYGGANKAITVNPITNDIELNKHQEEIVTKTISKYIEDYVHDRIKTYMAYSNVISSDKLTIDNITEFAINYNLTYMSFDDIFEGDMKFYKDTQTALKRAKEVQGSGVPYGIFDLLKDLTKTTKEEIQDSPLSEPFKIVKEDGSVEEHYVKQYDGFYGVTIKNTIRTQEEVLSNGVVAKELAKQYEKEGLSKEEALEKANKFLEGYVDTTVNDAQSYITFDEWIRRITARGQYNKYKELIDRINNESKPLSIEDLNAFIQVQKNFYYDLHYNAELSVVAPRQIKNAEFVIVPRLVKGTQLEKVHEVMTKFGIDQLNTEETSKAGKANILTLWDNNGELDAKLIEDLNKTSGFSSNFAKRIRSQETKQLFHYNYLYTQQETPQHMNAENKAAIQIMKKIIDNIDSKSPLYSLKEEFMALHSANIEESYIKLMSDCGVELDSNNNIVLNENGYPKGLNLNLFFEKLQAEAERQNLDSNMKDYLNLLDGYEVGGSALTQMPLFMSNVSTKLENIAQSVFNNVVTRQMLPGFHAAQITNVGFKSFNEQVTQRMYSSKLRYHSDENNNYTHYVEVMLPANNFGFKRTNDDGSLKSDKQLLDELKRDGLDEIIGYRIPTEGKQSVCIFKVVGFTDDALGSTIVVPDAWVSQTGSDFDIDSVYGIQYNTTLDSYGHITKIAYNEVSTKSYEDYVKSNMPKEDIILTENVEFNYNNYAEEKGLLNRETWSKENRDKVIKENSKKARQNKMLDNMKTILSSRESLEENLSRSNFDDLIKALNKIYKGTALQIARTHRTSYDFLDQAAYREDAMSGSKLKAFSVTRDTFCSICNTVQPIITKDAQFTVVLPLDEYNEKDIIDSFGDNAKIDEENNKIILTVDKLGWSKNNKNIIGKILTAYSSQTTAHILDNIKEGSIPNENDYTFAVFKTFPDVGLDYNTAISFLMQPGITRIVEAYNANKSIYISGNYNPIHTAIKNIALGLGIEVKKNTPIDKVIEELNKDESIRKILKNKFGINKEISLDSNFIKDFTIDVKLQIDRIKEKGIFNSSPVEGLSINQVSLVYDLLNVLQFNKLNILAKNIGDIARVCNPDKFGAKQSIFATNKVFEDINTLIENDNLHEGAIKLRVGSENFLESIYPGISHGMDNFINTNDKKSSYPTLNAFLKYSTAPSIKINRTLFDTQSEFFVKLVKHITNNFSGTNKIITEDLYKDYQNYILNHLYNNTSVIKNPLVYDSDSGTFTAGIEPSDDTVYNEERQRIFGYNKSNELVVADNEGNDVIFSVEDVNNPTKEEIESFLTLSPAQKVLFVQNNFSDGLIVKYLKANTHNTFKNSIGKHTIKFQEDIVDIEQVYDEFSKTLNNNNPILSATAIDIIKYSFVVDGFRMKSGGVSKVIKNNALYNNTSDGNIINGTNLVFELNNQMRHLEQMLDEKAISNIEERYIRSNSNIKQINTKTIETNDNNKSELGFSYYGLKRLDTNNKDLLLKYDIAYENNNGELVFNKYIKLKDNSKKEAILYKIYSPNSTNVFLIPLNKLEANEQTNISANNDNNKHQSKLFYAEAIKNFTGQTEVLWDKTWSNSFETKLKEDKGTKPTDYLVKTEKTTTKNNIYFDINNPKDNERGAFDSIKKQVNDWFGINNGVNGKLLYISNLALSHYLVSTNTNDTITQEILIERSLDGKNTIMVPRRFKFTKVKPSEYSRYLKLQHANDNLSLVTNSSKRELLNKIQDTVKSNGKDLVDYPVFVVSEEIEYDSSDIRLSALDENAAQMGVQAFNFVAQAGYESGVKAISQFKTATGTNNPKAAVDNIGATVRITAEFVDNTVSQILHDFDYFTMNTETGNNLSIDSVELMELVAKDKDVQDKFLKTILTAQSLLYKFKEYQNLDIDSEDEKLKYYLKLIQDKINTLSTNNKLNRAFRNFANEYLKKLSNNPMVVNDILNLFDGYHSTNIFEAGINDLQENANPLVQIVTKVAMENIRTAELLAKERVREMKKFKLEVEKEAKDKGLTIDMDKIVDENGVLRQPYDNKLREEFISLIEEVESLKQQGSEMHIEYMLAKHKLDAFKLKHFEQPVVDSYYKERLAIEEEMLKDGIGKRQEYTFLDDPFANVVDPLAATLPKEDNLRYIGHRYILSYYKKLKERQWELRSHVDSQGNLADHWAKELNEIEEELHKLVYGDKRIAIDPIMEVGEQVPDKNKDPEAYKRYLLYGGAHRAALNKYIKAMRELNDKYFKYDSIYGFDEELERNLDTIKQFEKRNSSGDLIVPISELMKEERYRKAKEWIANNARFVYGDDFWKEVNDALLGVKGKTLNDTRKLVRKYSQDQNAVDIKGVIDASQFTKEQIKAIREAQLKYYNYEQQSGLSSKKLIRNGSNDKTVYTSEFYKKMTSDGNINKAYNEIVDKINSILQKVYNPYLGTVRTDELSVKDLQELNGLYKELENISKKTDSTNGKEVAKFISENVDFNIDEDKFNALHEWAKRKSEILGEEWYNAWYDANVELKKDKNGELVLDLEGKAVVQPNSRLYGTIKPKKEVIDKYTDHIKTKSLKRLENLLISDGTEYYYKTYQEKLAEGKEIFNEWYNENHIYNPFKGEMVPLECWTETKPNPNSGYDSGQWIPSFDNTKREIKDGRDAKGQLDGSIDARNHNYKEGSHYINYKKGSGHDSTVKLNEYETKIRDMFFETLQVLAKTESAKRYIKDGTMPSERKRESMTKTDVLIEGAKFIGYVNKSSGSEEFYDDADITFANDRTMDMPMLAKFADIKGVKFEEEAPNIENYGGDIDKYNKDVEDYNTRKSAYKEVQQKIHNDALNRDWWSVMENFIIEAGHFNAVQEQKLLLYYGEEMLKNYQVYQQRLGKTNLTSSTTESSGYKKVSDTNIHGQYVNWVRRLIYNQYKKDNGAYTKAADFLQNMTSNIYMMGNIKGGIANILMGETNILGEQLARQYFNSADWLAGKKYWMSGSLSFIQGMYRETSTSVPDAIVKFMDIIDYDEVTHNVKVADVKDKIQRARDLMFSPQAVGEHLMQNGAMFAMMYSHRLFENPRYGLIAGEPKYIAKNFAEHSRDLADVELMKLLNDEQKKKFEELKESELKDANDKKEYVRFRRNLSTEFAIRYLSKEERKLWRKNYDNAIKQAKEDFKDDTKYPTLISQFTLAEDSKLGFKDDSILSKIPLEERIKILGRFKGKVVSVNKKIHGNYGKLDRAKIENTWYGSMVMQYHKHIYPGFMKYFRKDGYYNEERNSIEKGCFWSLCDFLGTNVRAVKIKNNMTDEQVSALESVQNVFRYSLDFCLEAKSTYHLLSDYDKANMRRSLATLCGFVGAIALAIGAKFILDDDDESFVGNLMMYEADRLASESMQYNPYGLYAQGKQLWSQPVATLGVVNDLIASMGQISKALIEGDDFDPTYHSGRFSGQNKLTVYITRRIPLYRQYDGLVNIADNNRYYKLTDNGVGFSTKIYDAITK